MKRCTFFLLFFIGYNNLISYSQTSMNAPYPQIGGVVLDHIFSDVVNYPQRTARISDFRGKWLILDFWGYSCSSCIESFPKMNQLDQEYRDKIKIIMVGATKSRASTSNTRQIELITKRLYARLSSKYHLNLTVAFDSSLYLNFDVGALPHILVVDPNGIIRAKTIQINSSQIETLLAGGNPTFERSFSYSEKRAETYNQAIPLLSSGGMSNGGNDTNFLFRSLLTFQTDELPNGRRVNLFKKNNKYVPYGKLEVFQYDLAALFRLAYFGISHWDANEYDINTKFSKQLYFATKDSAKLSLSKEEYAYSLIVPKERSTATLLMKAMQSDLQNYFEYTAKREKREMPVYFLQVKNSNKVAALATKGGEPKDYDPEIPYQGVRLRNYKVDDFIKILEMKLNLKEPIINKTGIDFNIDIDFKADMLDRMEVINRLEDYGFMLIKGYQEMEVVAIYDTQ